VKLNFLSRREAKDERLAERIAAATTPSHVPAPPPPPPPEKRWRVAPKAPAEQPPRDLAPQPAYVDPARQKERPAARTGAELRRNPPLPQVESAPLEPEIAPPAPVEPAASRAPEPRPAREPAAPQSYAFAIPDDFRPAPRPAFTAPSRNIAPPPPLADGPDGPEPRQILNSIGEVVYDWDITADRLIWGPNFADVLGLGPVDKVATGIAYANHLAPQSAASRYDVVKAGGADTGSGVPYQTQYGLLAEGRGPVVWVEDTGRWFAGADGHPGRAHGVVRVITERYEAEKALAFSSHFDPLTGALNRARLIEHLIKTFAAEQRERTHFCVLLAGIENLFAINRNYGYDVADQLIAGVAGRLRDTMRGADVLARYAGNKFAMVLHACDGEQMEVAARRFLAAVGDEAIETSSGPVPVSLRIGGVVCPRQGRTPQAALQHAEEALDLARKPIGLRFVAYEQSIVRDDARMRALIVADEIVTSLNQGRIAIALQPIVHAKTGEVAFMESLVRLLREDGSVVPPEAILPVAEKAGLIHLVDQRVLELTVAEMVADPTLLTTVNASGATVHDPEWTRRLAAICSLHPGLAERLTIEITETVAIEDIEATRRAIAAMKECGVKVAIDDFGAGHTSFRNLRSLSVDLLKIDGAFMLNLPRSDDDSFFVRTLVDLARHLGIPTVAEWVENEETAKLLAEWGVDYLQGHLFGHARLMTRREDDGQAVA
jgi:diguanylate cyclase (GGDEF)-like protein